MGEEDNVKWLEKPIIGAPRYIILLCGLIFAHILILIIVGYNIIGKYEVNDGYELFRDILTIILAVLMLAIAILGYGIYEFLLHSAEKKVGKWTVEFKDKINKEHVDFLKATNKKQKDFFLYTTSMIDLNNGYSVWRDYKVNKTPERLDHAIAVTEHAYLNVQKLDTHKKRPELLKCQILNNLSYYLATRNEEGDIELAKQYAEFFMERTRKYPQMSENWKHTNVFIRDAIITSKKED